MSAALCAASCAGVGLALGALSLRLLRLNVELWVQAERWPAALALHLTRTALLAAALALVAASAGAGVVWTLAGCTLVWLAGTRRAARA